MQPRPLALVAVDTGGTFTDLIAIEAGQVHTLKVLSTPSDPSRAVVGGVRALTGGVPPVRVVHGSTVATNALLERRGARTALVTNEGFRDLLLIGRQARPDLYALHPRRPEPLVPPELCWTLPGRLGPRGEELEPLDLSAVSEHVAAMARAGVKSVVVALLHSYADPVHEQAAGRALGEAAAALGHDLDITLSSDVVREFREYERAATAAVNAYVRPLMGGYLRRLESDLAPSRLSIMLSNGGLSSADHAARHAVQTVLSGPAGGVVGAIVAAKQSGVDRIITFDMGGTSTDVALCDRRLPLGPDSVVSGVPLRVAALDIHTVGAGGGSIARLDAGGALRVGPQSAGAAPGPACYGRGGTVATVTDANLVLGRLSPEHFLGGEMALEPATADAAIAPIAAGLGCDLATAALGVCAVANAVMERALKVISVARGHDPREMTLVTFGGAGGMHACDLARGLGIHRVLVPPHPGLLSALGMLWSDVRLTLSQTVLIAAPAGGTTSLPAAAEPAFAPLEAQAHERLEAEGVPPERRTLLRSCDLRYAGQSFELNVPWTTDLAEAFHAAHEARYGFALRDEPVELVTARLEAVGSTDHPALATAPERPHAAAPHASTQMTFASGPVSAALYHRDTLEPGACFAGPALLVEYSSTTVVPPGWSARVDHQHALLLEDAG